MKRIEMIEDMDKVTHSELLEWFASGKNAEEWIVSRYNFDDFSDEDREKAHADLRIAMITTLTEDLLAEEFPYAALKQMGVTPQEMEDACAYIRGQQVAIDLSLVAGEWVDGRHTTKEQVDAVKAKLAGNRKHLLLGIAIGSVATAAVAYCLTRADK